MILLALSFAAPAAVFGQAIEDDEVLFGLIVAQVVAHDLGIPIGLLPFPITQLTGEAVQYSSNISLKAFRPYLVDPQSATVSPRQFHISRLPDDDNDADSCSFNFYLPNSTATYENAFGIIPTRPAYDDDVTNTRYAWFQRWGILPPPRIWHGNSSARLSVRSVEPVRRWDIATGNWMQFPVPGSSNFTEYYWPIQDAYSPMQRRYEVFGRLQPARQDLDGQPGVEGGQDVFLPIGTHRMQWTAATQLNLLGDVFVPGALLAFAVHSELKTAKAGLPAARKVDEAGGIADTIVAQGDNAAESLNTQLARRKFDSIWEAFFTRKKPGPIGRQVRTALCSKLVGVLVSIVDIAIANGLERLEEGTSAQLAAAGQLNPRQKTALDLLFQVVVESGEDALMDSIKDWLVEGACDGSGSDEPAWLKWTLRALSVGFLQDFVTFDTGVSRLNQFVTVYDDVPPQWQAAPPVIQLEALDLGGIRRFRVLDELRESVASLVFENCGRTPNLVVDAPELLPVGTTEVIWEARDRGPNPPGVDPAVFSPTAAQTIVVTDTSPPLLLPPPSRVFEADADTPAADLAIGNGAATDIADPNPTIDNDLPDNFVFPLNSRTEILWTASDASGNPAPPQSQLITLKATGTNTAPVANATTRSGITGEQIPITLSGTDTDELEGRVDPLSFKIVQQPANGGFVAPLLPFFIEDYRTGPNDGLPGYDPTSGSVTTYILTSYCDADTAPPDNFAAGPPVDFVHQAKFVKVTDEGIRYVLDEGFECGGTSTPEVNIYNRFSRWNSRGEFLGELRLGPNEQPVGDAFVVDRDPVQRDGAPGNQYLYYNLLISSGSSSELNLWKCAADFVGADAAGACELVSNFDGSVPEIDNAGLSYSLRDPARGLVYVLDGISLDVVEEQAGSTDVTYVGEIGPKSDGNVVSEWYGDAPVLDIGADGSVYVLDADHHRVHKLGAPRRSANGEWLLGEYVGWAGKCTGSGNNACDTANERSRGFACSFETNGCTPALADFSPVNADFFGAGQGQFENPNYLAIDPNDVLYVADTGNNRIQRLTSDGSFAGEALADESGFSKNDRPSFVIGQMGPPASVSVNSSQFYVVDRQAQFVHVFGTLPFTEITDNSATVTYISDQAFPVAADLAVDTFTFSVSDGLAESDPAPVEVTVGRNYRQPEALTRVGETPEDTGVCIELPALDRDGIIGKDYFGRDSLTYSVTMQSERGTLTDDGCTPDPSIPVAPGSTRYYEPEADFFGRDQFAFRVNDGREDSNVAMYSIDVLPVNDPPKLSIESTGRVALGHATILSSTFSDDPSDGYTASADWGDGQSSTTGDYAEDANGDPYIDGVVVSEPPDPDAEGRTFAEHVYTTAGSRAIEICVTDSDGETGCDQTTISVEPLVVLGMGGSVYEAPLLPGEITQLEVDAGVPYTYELTVVNQRPQAGVGLAAEDVVLAIALPPGLDYGEITIDRGGCVRDDLNVSCSLGDMAPDDSAVLVVAANSSDGLIYTRDFDIDATLTTVTPALENELEFKLSVSVIAASNDSDGDGMTDAFEEAYGLDPSLDDSALDADGDGLSNLREYEIGSSPLSSDTDGDGISDFDEDRLYGTNPASADSDADGMPDPYELEFGFDPLFAGDGDADADLDGRSNVDEYAAGSDPRRDDIAPEITVPADVLVDSTGALTNVSIGTASAIDGKDGALMPVADSTGPYPPGPNRVTWSVSDAAGNVATAVQRVDVVPIVSFATDQTVPENFNAEAVIELNGPAVEYPVTVPYAVTGTATNPDDHDAADGTLTIDTGVRASLPVAIAGDRNFEPDEDIVITMIDPIGNAVRGVSDSQTITVSEPNVGPIVDITIWQGSSRVTTVVADAGPVFVTADVTDFAGDTHTFDWSGSDPGVTNPADATDDSFQIDPAGLGEGIYRLRAIVTDDGTPVGISDVSALLRVIATAPVLSADDDSDGDGISDLDEGYGDADGDRVADLYDAIANSNMLAILSDGRIIETETGLSLRLGETTFAMAANDPNRLEESFAEDIDFGYPDEALDFEVIGLVSGQTATVVLPLSRPIAPGAELRTFIDGQWQPFTVDNLNSTMSAPGAGGACPAPGSSEYSQGLIPGNGCLQLVLQDGGENDADSASNSQFVARLGLGVPVRAEAQAAPLPPATISGAGEAEIVAFTLSSDSGDAILSSITLDTAGTGNERSIRAVRWFHDVNANRVLDAEDRELALGRYERNDAQLTLRMSFPIELPVGDSSFLVTYFFDR